MTTRGNGPIVGTIMLAAGTMIGAGLALLYAPQTGKKTRKQLSRYTQKVRNEADAKIRDAACSISDAMDDLAEKTSELVERGGEATEEWRKRLLDSIERGQKDLEKQRRQLLNLWR